MGILMDPAKLKMTEMCSGTIFFKNWGPFDVKMTIGPLIFLKKIELFAKKFEQQPFDTLKNEQPFPIYGFV